MKHVKFATNLYMIFWSFIIGVATAAYLDLINWVIDFFWKDIPALFHIPTAWQPLALCLPLGLVIGLVQKYIGPYPLTIAEVLDEKRVTGHFSYQRWWKILLAGLLILGAGASVGPEASASGLVAGMIYWLGCRYKLIRSQEEQLAQRNWLAQVKTIWTARLSSVKLDQPITVYFKSDRQKKSLYTFWTLVAFPGLATFFRFFPQEGVIGLHRPQINWDWHGLLVVLPALIVGWAFGFLFVKLGKISERYVGRDQRHIRKALLGGLMLVLAALFSRDILFSGEFSIVPFAHSSLQMAPIFLILFALIKAFVTNFGFALGWRGGTIFPAIFSTLAVGAALAHFLPWMPQLTASLVVASGITVILERPLLTTIILWLLLPIQFAIFILLTCLLVGWVVKKVSQLKP